MSIRRNRAHTLYRPVQLIIEPCIARNCEYAKELGSVGMTYGNEARYCLADEHGEKEHAGADGRVSERYLEELRKVEEGQVKDKAAGIHENVVSNRGDMWKHDDD